MPASRRQDTEESTDRAARAPLASTLVAYADRSDRRTIYPSGTTSVARMSTWLTADADAFTDLGSMR